MRKSFKMLIKLNSSLPALRTFSHQFVSKTFGSLVKFNPRLLWQLRFYCSPSEKRVNVGYKKFEDFMIQRRDEAQRSFVVQVFSEQSCWDLHDYCNATAPVRFMQHYSINSNHFVIAELLNGELQDLFETCRHMDDFEVLPVKSPFLWFKTGEERKKKKPSKNEPFPSYKEISEAELLELISSTDSLSDQMKIVYETTRLDEVGIRLRFITARQVELALTGLFPDCTVLPFGSSVTGFGKRGCDLDLGLRYSNLVPAKNNSRLVFQSKEGGHTGRPQVQRQMEVLADILHLFLPGCSNVRRILKARVPIVKYYHDFTGLECDLSMTDLSGVYMSEMFWLYGNLDSRVRPLVFTVRRWAQSVGLTSLVPGKYITNFSLTAMVVFYLQTVQVLPSYLSLVQLARPDDSRFAGEVNCTFVRDAAHIPLTNSSADVASLLCNFFEYFSNFDYERCGICIRSGKPVSKPDHSPLYLVNPLEPSLNVSRNVSPEELTRLKVECRNASWLLQSKSSLTSIFKPVHFNQQKTVSKTGKRLVSVKQLFKSQNFS